MCLQRQMEDGYNSKFSSKNEATPLLSPEVIKVAGSLTPSMLTPVYIGTFQMHILFQKRPLHPNSLLEMLTQFANFTCRPDSSVQ